ncbi:MAG: cation:proton antiporter, partial [Duodenibacillus sp.]|nr:cation:proton antiporter [Duodenibacillus sp.]
MASAFCWALIFGYVAERIKAPSMVGYVLAGVTAAGLSHSRVVDLNLASQLSEIGIMLLMFGVGLHFSVKDLLKVRSVAVPGALAQMTLSTGFGFALAFFWWEWAPSASLIFGLSLSCASTVVATRSLQILGSLSSTEGRVSVGWLVVEDMVCVFILVLLPVAAQILAGGQGADSMRLGEVAWLVLKALARIAAFIVVMMAVGRRAIPWALAKVAETGSRELFTLFVIASAIGIAFGASAVFEVSTALGAFFAGMVLQESDLARRAAKESLPLQDAFAVLFFVGVGMMFEWRVVV